MYLRLGPGKSCLLCNAQSNRFANHITQLTFSQTPSPQFSVSWRKIFFKSSLLIVRVKPSLNCADTEALGPVSALHSALVATSELDQKWTLLRSSQCVNAGTPLGHFPEQGLPYSLRLVTLLLRPTASQFIFHTSFLQGNESFISLFERQEQGDTEK